MTRLKRNSQTHIKHALSYNSLAEVVTTLKRNSQTHIKHALSCNSPAEVETRLKRNSQTHIKHALSCNSPSEILCNLPTEMIKVNIREQQKRHDVDENHATITYMQLTPYNREKMIVLFINRTIFIMQHYKVSRGNLD